jgi:hypothetical protein
MCILGCNIPGRLCTCVYLDVTYLTDHVGIGFFWREIGAWQADDGACIGYGHLRACMFVWASVYVYTRIRMYVCMYVCASIRKMHREVVVSISAECNVCIYIYIMADKHEQKPWWWDRLRNRHWTIHSMVIFAVSIEPFTMRWLCLSSSTTPCTRMRASPRYSAWKTRAKTSSSPQYGHLRTKCAQCSVFFVSKKRVAVWRPFRVPTSRGGRRCAQQCPSQGKCCSASLFLVTESARQARVKSFEASNPHASGDRCEWVNISSTKEWMWGAGVNICKNQERHVRSVSNEIYEGWRETCKEREWIDIKHM